MTAEDNTFDVGNLVTSQEQMKTEYDTDESSGSKDQFLLDEMSVMDTDEKQDTTSNDIHLDLNDDKSSGSEDKLPMDISEEQEKTMNFDGLHLIDDKSSDNEAKKSVVVMTGGKETNLSKGNLSLEDDESSKSNDQYLLDEMSVIETDGEQEKTMIDAKHGLNDEKSSNTEAKSLFVMAEGKKRNLSEGNLNLKDDESSGSKEQVLLDEMPTFHPPQRRLSLKMKSTGDIGSKSQSLESNEDLKKIIQSFKHSEVNHYRVSDLFSDNSVTDIEDSHTSYRKDLEREITELKVKLAVAQERADTLQNNYNRVSYDNQVFKTKMDEMVEKYEGKVTHCEQLETVVAHLQGKAEEASEVRKILQEKVEKMEKMTKSTRKHKQEIRELKRDVEGLGMEKQGLKVEIDWLKKQLKTPAQDDLSDLGESSENPDEELVTGIREYLSFPSPSPGPEKSKRSLTENKEDEDSLQSQKGIFSSFKFPSLSVMDTPSGPTRHRNQEEVSNSKNQQPTKTAMKSSFLSFLGVGASENNLKTAESDSESDSEEVVQYQPNSSSRMLVPKRLNENY